MKTTDSWMDLIWLALFDIQVRLLAVLPGVLAMITLAAGGLAVAWLAARLLSRLAHAIALDSRAETWGLSAALRRGGIQRPPSEVLRLTVFWGLFLLFATLAVDALAVPGAGRIASFLFAWIPALLGAMLILLMGWLGANFLGQAVLIAAVNAGVPEARHLARAARWGVLLFAGAMAVTHLGIAKEMVLVAFGITFGGLIFALSLAFGLGGRTLAREILERRLRHEPHPSETLTHL
ncbi:MAG: hypothetical protein L0027_04595 [Candidatus Rokubacteria bacterium]|nr:hypothetical protein [Candidatus Rokubacteria bacterium]